MQYAQRLDEASTADHEQWDWKTDAPEFVPGGATGFLVSGYQSPMASQCNAVYPGSCEGHFCDPRFSAVGRDQSQQQQQHDPSMPSVPVRLSLSCLVDVCVCLILCSCTRVMPSVTRFKIANHTLLTRFGRGCRRCQEKDQRHFLVDRRFEHCIGVLLPFLYLLSPSFVSLRFNSPRPFFFPSFFTSVCFSVSLSPSFRLSASLFFCLSVRHPSWARCHKVCAVSVTS